MSIEAGWLKRTFKTRDGTETLLRPELESGLITLHDYNVAVSFLPGYHRYHPYVYGAAGATAVAGYMHLKKKVHWLSPRFAPACTLGYGVGYLVGLSMFVGAHRTFVAQLDDREKFFQALKNVRQRTEGRWDVPMHGATDVNRNTTGTSEGVTSWTEQAQAPTNPAGPIPQTQPSTPSPPSRPPSRWEEIRAANARNARTSSWDALRQQHERTSGPVTDKVQNPSTPGSERAQEQARFDAMLEAERSLGRN